MKDKKLILASGSPERKAILSNLKLNFTVIPSNYDEKLSDLNFSYEKIENLAFQKANSLLLHNKQIKNALVLGADTVVVLNNKILGKPKNKSEAFFMLKALSAKTHSVVTSICLLDSEDKNFKKILSSTTNVTFNSLSEEMIKNYILNFKPFDKAGAYGIQELPEGFLNKIDGDFENVVGLSSIAVKNVLEQCKLM